MRPTRPEGRCAEAGPGARFDGGGTLPGREPGSRRDVRTGMGTRAACAALVAVLLAGTSARGDPLEFEHLSLEQGLSQSIIEGIVQDRIGFLWFATEDGLNRFDGYRYRVLRQDPEDANSLSYNDLKCVVEDRDGVLWIGTFGAGVNRYDPRSGIFTRYRNRPSDPDSLALDIVRVLRADRSGKIWVGTQGGGLDRLDPATGRFEHFRADPGDPRALADGDVRALHEDRAGTLWVGTAAGGLHRFDAATGTFVRYPVDARDPGALPHPWVQAILEDRAGVLWVGTLGGGLARLDRARGRFVRVGADPARAGALPGARVTALVEDHEGHLWVGTDGAGLARFDAGRGTFNSYRHDPANPRTLATDRVFSLFEDRSRVLWVGTYGGGLSRLDLGRKKFRTVRHDPRDPGSLSHDIVWSIAEDRDGALWVGTDSGGLNRIDRATGGIRHYRHDPRDPASLAHDTVRYVYLDRRGELWVATNGGGLDRLDRTSGRFEHHRHDPRDPASLAHDDLRIVFEDRLGNLWVGTYGGGLDRLDRATGRFEHFRTDAADPGSLPSPFVRWILEDRSGELWVATQGGGLARLDRATGRFSSFRFDPGDPTSIGSDFVFAALEARDGALWVGTYGGGIARLDRATGRFRRYTADDGLASDSVYGLLEDEDGRLWISTNRGLTRFDPARGEFRSFGVRDGLQSDEFNGGSCYESARGEMFFGGIHGFNSFFPAQIVLNDDPPPVAITDLQLFNRSVLPGEEIDGRRILEGPIEFTEAVELAFRQDVVTLEFAALHFPAPERNRYRYRLEGFSGAWIDARADRRSATFTRLSPGDYVFRVQAANPDGAWNESGARLAIRVLPPFWATWWFRAAALALAGGLIALAWARHARAIRLRAELAAAHEAQMAIMPRADPALPGFEISGTCVPAHQVGGDFFDYVWLEGEPSRLCIVIGDVSGKGMQSALAAAMSSGMVHAQLRAGAPLAEAMTRLNRAVHRKVERPMFTALCLALFDPQRRALELVNAGVCPPLLKRAGEVRELEAARPTLPLGALPATRYRSVEVELRPGDVVLFYTDGAPEAQDRAGVQYGYEALRSLLAGLATERLRPPEIRAALVAELARFARGSRRQDDTTLVVVKVA